MNKINTFDVVNRNESSNWKNLGYALMIAALFSSNSPIEAQTNNSMNNNSQNMELVEMPVDFLGNIERRSGVKFPPEYRGAFLEFVKNNEILQDKDVLEFTENFIVEEMKNDRGIDKSNQILFVTSAVFEKYTRDYLYYGADGNDNRLNEYSSVVDKANECGKKGEDGLKAYLKNLSAEAKQQSAEYDRQIADAKQRSADAKQRSADAKQRSADAKQRSADAEEEAKQNIYAMFDELVNCYNLCKTPSDFEKFKIFKSNIEDAISVSKHFGFDYKAILLKKLGGDENKLRDLFEKLDIKEWDENDFTDAGYDKRIYNILDHYSIVKEPESV